MGIRMGCFIAMFYVIGIVLGYSMGMFQWVCFISIAFNGYVSMGIIIGIKVGYKIGYNYRHKNGS